MEWYKVPKTAPEKTFPIGSIIEDEKAKYKILEGPTVNGVSHMYKCEVLEYYKEPPPELKRWREMMCIPTDKPWEWIVVLQQNLPNIRQLS